MKSHHLTLLPLIGLLLMIGVSCTENIDTSARYVFKERTAKDYLEEHEQFSMYVRLLREEPVSDFSATTVYQLLGAYGFYTIFAPTNDAIQIYLDSLVSQGLLPSPSWDAFTSDKVKDSIRHVLVLNSILDGTKKNDTYYYTWDFPRENEEFFVSTMNDRKLSVTISPTNPDSIFVDGAPVSTTNRDIYSLNAIIHEVGKCIAPSDETLGSTMHRLSYDYESGISVMARLIEVVGLVDTLSRERDYDWEYLRKSNAIPDVFNGAGSHFSNVTIPEHCRFGNTLFAETDEFWSNTLGKEIRDITPEDVKDWVISQNYYPNALDNGNYQDENNVLNQFVTYHLIPYRLPADKLVLHSKEKGYNYGVSKKPTIPVWVHYVTYGKRRLLRIWESLESDGVYLNRFPELDNGRRGTYHETACTEENEGIYINTSADAKVMKLTNAIIYPIEKPLAYTDHVRTELGKQRIRYDVLEFSPEMMNNDMRNMTYFMRYYFPPDEQYRYFNDIWVNSRETYFYVLNGYGQDWPNYQMDEVCTEGMYDCTWRVPPVPRDGIYEVRMGVSNYSSWRGLCQIYFGDDRDNLIPIGIPVDMTVGGVWKACDLYSERLPSNTGWEQDTDDDDYNAEVDKKMRNSGFMKGPEYIVCHPSKPTLTNRRNDQSIRRIILRQFMEADKTYYLRFKTVQDLLSRQLFIDYLEWCPKEVFDNPEDPEDIW